MTSIINVNNLGKRYILRHQSEQGYTTLRDTISSGFKGLINGKLNKEQSTSLNTSEEFWALKNVGFEIKQGERVGIVGRNGAGKSTLLKLLSRITEPTTGRIAINGRVASLLEVGTGFHPELTGRENIFLNGAILGMRKQEIRSKFDEIVEFAEIGKFLDTPVKRYSSGMYVRLAFAVAAHLESEVLIVDEVLAVGDLSFQKKCLGKMQDITNQERTVLFVSHNISAIRSLCNKGILLEQGNVAAQGDIDNVLDMYVKSSAGLSAKRVYVKPVDANASKAALLETKVMDSNGELLPSGYITQELHIQIIWQLNVDVPFLRVGIDIINSETSVVVSSMDTDTTSLYGKPREKGTYLETMIIPPLLLMPGNYSIKVFAGMPGFERIMEYSDVVHFELLDNKTHLSHVAGSRRPGFISTPLVWIVEMIDAA